MSGVGSPHARRVYDRVNDTMNMLIAAHSAAAHAVQFADAGDDGRADHYWGEADQVLGQMDGALAAATATILEARQAVRDDAARRKTR